MRLIPWCNRIIGTGYYLLFGLVPLLLTPWNYELFEYNKMMAVYGLTVIITAAWLVKAIRNKKLVIRRTVLDIPIVLFVLSQFVSALFSIDPHISWFGYYSRFNGGMFSVFSYVLLYYAFVSNTDAFSNDASDASGLYAALIRFLKTGLITAFAVSVYGILEHFGIDRHIWVQDVANRVFSTLGQPNWLAAYMIAFIPVALSLGLRAQEQKKKPDTGFGLTPGYWLYTGLAAVFFLTLLYTRSRSGLLGLAAALAVWLGFLFPVTFRRVFAILRLITSHKSLSAAVMRTPKQEPSKRIIPLFAVGVVFALVVFFNGSYIPQIDRYFSLHGLVNLATPATDTQTATPSAAAYTGPALETGGTESGTIRKYVWQGAVTAWKSSTKTLLIGTGTETFAFAFYRFRPVAHNTTSEWDFLYNKAHNEYLNYLATTGAFGLGSYLAVIAVFFIWFVRRQAKNPDPVAVALFAGWTSVLVTNFFGFSVVVTQLILFLFPAIILLLTVKKPPQVLRLRMDLPAWSAWIVGICGVYLLVVLAGYWTADRHFARGYQLNRSGLYAQSVPELTKAVAMHPAEPLYHDELASGYAALAVALYSSGDATHAADLAQNALAESSTAVRISPQNVNILKNRTKVYYTLSSMNPAYNAAAIATLTDALALSPNDPKIYYNLAILAGRDGDNDLAIRYLKQAQMLKPDYRDVYNALFIFYTREKKPDEARAVLQQYVSTIDSTDQQFTELLNE